MSEKEINLNKFINSGLDLGLDDYDEIPKPGEEDTETILEDLAAESESQGVTSKLSSLFSDTENLAKRVNSFVKDPLKSSRSPYERMGDDFYPSVADGLTEVLKEEFSDDTEIETVTAFEDKDELLESISDSTESKVMLVVFGEGDDFRGENLASTKESLREKVAEDWQVAYELSDDSKPPLKDTSSGFETAVKRVMVLVRK